MAILHTRETEFGVDATYWNVGSIQEDFKGKGAEIIMLGWVDEATRRANKQPIGAVKVTMLGPDYTLDVTRANAYVHVTSRPEFEGATKTEDKRK